MTRLRLLQAGLAVALAICCAGAQAEVEKTIYLCGEKQLCPFFKLKFKPPAGNAPSTRLPTK